MCRDFQSMRHQLPESDPTSAITSTGMLRVAAPKVAHHRALVYVAGSYALQRLYTRVLSEQEKKSWECGWGFTRSEDCIVSAQNVSTNGIGLVYINQLNNFCRISSTRELNSFATFCHGMKDLVVVKFILILNA